MSINYKRQIVNSIDSLRRIKKYSNYTVRPKDHSHRSIILVYDYNIWDLCCIKLVGGREKRLSKSKNVEVIYLNFKEGNSNYYVN